MNAEDKITKAKTWLILHKPFFGSLTLRLKTKEDPCFPHGTAATDGRWLLWNRGFIDSISPEETCGLLAHEVMHCASNHHTRRGSREPRKWNRAGDYMINDVLIKEGIQLPPGGLHHSSYEGMSTDHIYEILPEEPEDQKQAAGIVVDAGMLGENGDETGDKTGGGQSNNPQPIPNMDEVEQEWAVAVQQAAQVMKNQGKLPAHLERFVDEVTQPKVPWKEMLRTFATQPMRGDYSWMRGNRRHLYNDLYLPSNYTEGLGVVILAIDTSGSIGANELQQFESELNCILEDSNPERVYVVYVDTKVAGVEEFTPDELPVKIKAMGGGGTEFDPPFEWVQEQQINPACFIYLTDLYGTCTVPTPHYPVMWVTTGGQSQDEVNFGTVTNLEIN